MCCSGADPSRRKARKSETAELLPGPCKPPRQKMSKWLLVISTLANEREWPKVVSETMVK